MGYPRRPLPEVAFFQEGPGLRKWQWAVDGMKVINVTNLLGDGCGTVDTTNTDKYISLVEFEERYKHFAVDVGDIVVASSGNTYGKTGRITEENLPLMMNTSVIRFHSHDTDVLDEEYLYAFLRSSDFRNQVHQFVIGGAQPNFGPSHLKKMTIPAPDIHVQRRIGGCIASYDRLMQNNRRRIQLLEQAARLLYKEWFVHLRFPGHEHVTITDGVPEGWRWASLGEVTTIVMGNSPKGDTYNDLGEGMPLVNGPVEFGEVFTKRVKWTTKPSRVCQPNDLVVCVRGSTTGRNVKSDGEYCLGRGVCAISGSEQSYVDELFRANLPALLSLTTGATFPSWSGPALKSFPVVWPPKSLRKLFEFHCGPIAAQIGCLHKQNQRLLAARDLLLPRLMNGEIPV
jgi:type I restriction enzyme S subunit